MTRNDALTTPYHPSMPTPAEIKTYRPSSTAWDALPGTTPVPLMERQGCCWPIGGDKPQLFCNAHRDGPTAYCDQHAKILKSKPTEATK